MKTPKYILLSLALGLCSAQAITLTVHKDTAHKLDFTVDWHEVDSGQSYRGFTDIHADWTPFRFEIWGSAGSGSFFGHPERLVYFAAFGPDPYPLLFPVQQPARFMKLDDDHQSARFTYHAHDFPPIVSVPDAGSTLTLLGMAFGALGFIRHRI